MADTQQTLFSKVDQPDFVSGEHDCLRFWTERKVFDALRQKVANSDKQWSFLDGPMTANNPMGVHHAWGRTYKDAFHRYRAMTGHNTRWQNGFDCQGLWVEVEVEKQLGLGTKAAIYDHGVDKFVNACKARVLNFAARQTEQSVRLGYWMDWDDPDTLRRLGEAVEANETVTITTPSGKEETGPADALVAQLGKLDWGGSYFTFSTDNNETIWSFLKKCHDRGKVYRGHDVMPWSGRGGSAYSQMEVADGRKLTTHRAAFVRFPILSKGETPAANFDPTAADAWTSPTHEYLLVWTTTPWTLTSNVAAAINPDLEYVALKTPSKDPGHEGWDGEDTYYFAADNLDFKRLEREFKEGFGRPEWKWPEGLPKLKTLRQIFKERGGADDATKVKGSELLNWTYRGPFDDLVAQNTCGGFHSPDLAVSDSDLAAALEAVADRLPSTSLDEGVFTGDCIDRVVAEEVKNRSDSGFDFGRSLTDRSLSNSIQRRLNLIGAKHETPSLFSYLLTNEIRDDENKAANWLQDRAHDFRVAATRLREPLSSGRTSSTAHTVIDGGRDTRGNALVVAGEGTGIVHAAPGCGDIDHMWGQKYGLPEIAPLLEDGTFGPGFGPFTGLEAINPDTATLVFDTLKERGLLVHVEEYPHVYPHCWRTGDELVFRLVDEWFINMDWRDEIKEVTKSIEWLPDAIQGEQRELEWLSIMRDWMVSKKRFWGLALPIWRDEESGDFDVFGSVAELKAAYDERGGEGWEQFEGHTPHRPWIDAVKVKNPKTGNWMTRVEDVGNPWLDAGITPFSTLGYTEDRQHWEQWFPADFVSECFPGQFRNWFYSLLSLSTMMQHGETEDAAEKRPFSTLFGYRLVMNEQGQPMHKSDGTAIWFEEAAEQLGVDALRWLYLSHNPSTDLRFGTRHPDQPVTLTTPEGDITETKEGFPTCKVTSTPVDEVRRQVLIPLWNSYGFFVNYARLDGFDPTAETIPVADRPEIDRWLLSQLQALTAECHAGFEAYDTQRVCNAASEFIDGLSTWYIRRNRRRFWAKADDSGSATQTDKLAAYQTLHHTLVTLCKLLAPAVPFLTERMYRNLTAESESVHLCDYPEVDTSLLDEALNSRMDAARRAVALGHRLREEAEHRVRQPLAELRFAASDPAERAAVQSLADVIQDELNVKQVTACDNLDDLVKYSYKPNLKTLGPRCGKRLGVIRKELPEADPAVLDPLRRGEPATVTLSDGPLDLAPEDVLVSTEQSGSWASGDDAGLQVALSTELTPELIREGIARDVIRQIQQARKDAGLQIEDRIEVRYAVDRKTAQAIEEHSTLIMSETLASRLTTKMTIEGDEGGVLRGEFEVAVIE